MNIDEEALSAPLTPLHVYPGVLLLHANVKKKRPLEVIDDQRCIILHVLLPVIFL